MIQVHGLLQKIERPVLHRGNGFFHGSVCRQQQHGDRGVRLLRLPQNVQPRRPRHLQIGDHQQIPARAHLLDCGGAVRRFVHGVSRALQRLPHHGAQFGFIFNKQKRFHLSRFYHESWYVQGTTAPTCAEKGISESVNGSRLVSRTLLNQRAKREVLCRVQNVTRARPHMERNQALPRLGTYLKTIFIVPTPGLPRPSSTLLPCHPTAAGAALIPFSWRQFWLSCH